MTLIDRLKGWAAELKTQLMTLWYCRSHPDTPLAARLLAALVVGYALSPIDLIPDFIPVIGYLDDLILVPLGIYLVLHMIPAHVIAESRRKAEISSEDKPVSYVAAAFILLVWIALAWWAWAWWVEWKKP